MDVPEEQAAAPKSSLQPAAPMKIFVTASRTVTLDVEPRDSIATVALLVSRKLGVSRADVRLSLAGKPLAADRTLADYAVRPLATLLALGRLRGGLTVFTCPVCRKQMISDAFPSEVAKDAEGHEIRGLRVFQSRKMTAGGEDVDVGAGGAFGGAGEDEGTDDAAETVDAIEYTFDLKAVDMKTADLKAYLKAYFQGVRARMKAAGKDPETEIKPMMAAAPAAVVFLLTKNRDCEVLVNSDYNMEGAICMREWTEAGNRRRYYYIMAGLEGGRAKCGF